MKKLSGPAFIFPAFISEFPLDPFGNIPELDLRFSEYLKIASLLADPELASVSYISGYHTDNELRTQYLTYIYSCAVSDLLASRNIIPSWSAGYSMGIYAALVNAGAISFADGLGVIRKAWEVTRNVLDDQKYGMCTIIGLSREDIETLIVRGKLDATIVNRNSPFAFVISGRADDIMVLRDMAIEEGALNLHLLDVTIPYHSEFLGETQKEFSAYIHSIRILKPVTGIISLIDQHVISDEASISEEIIRNLYSPLNWYKTQEQMMKLGVDLFIECGPGKSLVKNAKFIEGNYQFLSLTAFIKHADH